LGGKKAGDFHFMIFGTKITNRMPIHPIDFTLIPLVPRKNVSRQKSISRRRCFFKTFFVLYKQKYIHIKTSKQGKNFMTMK